jgi:hypothetical protein
LLSANDLAGVEPAESCDIVESFLVRKSVASCIALVSILAWKK